MKTAASGSAKYKRLLIFVVVILVMLSACGKGNKPEQATQIDSAETVTLDTKYVTVSYPKSYEKKLIHKEVVQDSVAMEIFSTILDGTPRELFRIYFNDVSQGVHIGYIIKGPEEIPVSYYVCEYNDGDFKTQQVRTDYYAMLEVFNIIVNSICENSQFSEERLSKIVNYSKISQKYWTVELPEMIRWEEYETEDLYRVDYYGLINEERVDLYSIGFGEMEADYSVGLFTVEDEQRKICIRIYDVPENYNWGEEDYNSIYRMLESVNTIVDAIVQDDRYVESDS